MLASFREIYTAHAGAIARFLVRLGVSDAELDDVVQEVFMVAFKKRDSYDPSRPLFPWLCGIAVRAASEWRRRPLRREVPVAEPAENLAPLPEGAPAALRQVMAHQLVLRGLRALTDDQRTVLVLSDLEGLSAAEVAQSTEVPVGTVYSRLHEARRRFTAAMTAAGAGPLPVSKASSQEGGVS